MKRSVILLLVMSALIAVPAHPSSACSCIAASPPAKAASADIIFTGVAKEGDPDPSKGPPITYWTTFQVKTVYKGELGPLAAVETTGDEASCGLRFVEGERYTVFARAQEDGLDTNVCMGTTKGGIHSDAYDLTARLPNGTGTQFAPEEKSFLFLWMLVAVGAVLLLGIGLGMRWRHGVRARDPSSRRT